MSGFDIFKVYPKFVISYMLDKAETYREILMFIQDSSLGSKKKKKVAERVGEVFWVLNVH